MGCDIPKLIILRGLPASGKTTWVNEQLKDKEGLIVSRDTIRKMMGPLDEWTTFKEERVRQMRDFMIIEGLKKKFDVYVDDTNITGEHVRHFEQIVEEAHVDAKLETKEFNTSVVECIRRDSERGNSVGAEVIEKLNSKKDF